MFLDIGGALNKGYQAYEQAKTQEEQKRMLAEQFKAQMAAQQQQMAAQQQQMAAQQQQMQLRQLQMQGYQTKNEEADLQVKQLKNQILKQNTWMALDAYNKSNGDISYLNKFLKQHPDAQQLFGAIRVDKINPETDAEALQAQGIDPNIVKQNPFRFIKAIDAQGNVHYVDMNGIYGLTGYSQYKTQQELQELKQKMMIAKLSGFDPGMQQWENLYAKAREVGFDNLTPQEQALYKALQKKYTFAPTNVDKAAEAVNDGTDVSMTLTQSIQDPSKLQQLIKDKKFIENARKYQILTGHHMLQQDRKFYLDSFSMLKTAHGILNKLSKLKEEDIAKGPLDQGIQKLKTYFTTDKLKNMSPEDRRKFINSIQMNTKVGLLLKQYLLAMSGQGVTDEEYQRVKTIIEGGDLSNLTALKASLSSFYDYKKNSLLGRIKSDAMTYPADVIDILTPYQKYLYTNFDVNPDTMNITQKTQHKQNSQNDKKTIMEKYIQMLNNVKVE